MAIVFDTKSIEITVKSDRAVLTASFDGDTGMVHLTEGFVSVKAKEQGDAFTIEGKVDVIVDQAAEADAIVHRGWKFGFIQIARTITTSFVWSGRRDSEGEVELVLSSPPAWPQDKLVSFDANTRNRPFISTGPHLGFRNQEGGKIKVEVSNSMGDHPTQRCSLKVPNQVTKSANFLSSMEREFEAFSIFVAQDPDGKFQHLAHVRWLLSVDVRFQWRGNKPSVRRIASLGMTFDKPVNGPPTDAAVVAILPNPGPPFQNDTAEQAVPVALANHINLRETAKRSLLIPKDFYK